MKTPSYAHPFNCKYIEDIEEMEYCNYINDLIREIATTKGKSFESPDFYGTSYVYQQDGILCIYKNSDYGNDQYQLALHEYCWNDIPAGVTPVHDEDYNVVYSFQDSLDRNVLMMHIPGNWIEILRRASIE